MLFFFIFSVSAFCVLIGATLLFFREASALVNLGGIFQFSLSKKR